MTIREVRLPKDLMPLGDMLVDTFQYPENPTWSLRSDETEQIADTIRSMRRLWPVIRALQLVVPQARDLIRGHLWEEDGQIGGVTLVQRKGSTNLWNVGTVGVLPAFRRRGLARKLLMQSLDMIRQKGGTHATLGVINGNVPAQSLYRSLGFEEYRGTYDFTREPGPMPAEPVLPSGYTVEPLRDSDWRTRYRLADRIMPDAVRVYEPVEIGRFRHPRLMLLLAPLLRWTQRKAEQGVAIRHTASGEVIALGEYTASKRPRGFHSISVHCDPAHPEIPAYLASRLLREALAWSPDLRVEMGVQSWMSDVVAAVESLGFERRLEYRMMGLHLR